MGLRVIDDADGKAIKILPRGEERPIFEARDDFVEREGQVPGPMTIVYRPPLTPALPTPRARSLAELVDYSERLQHVTPDEYAELNTPEVKDAVDRAWHILARNPHLYEHEKKEMMRDIYQALMRCQDSVLFEQVMTLPNDVDVEQ
mmetsp:Transcript_19950/g.79554  ORF Transcript_19950/g.79554 Transcript_19950/m.79554 type:complete len:146 (+) Transcript_19950:1412-1849(+)